MAFPSNPSANQIYTRFGRKFKFKSETGTWSPIESLPESVIASTSISALDGIDITTTSPEDGQTLVWDDANSKFVPGEAAGGSTTVYATVAELPLSGNDAGAQAFVSATNRLYLWNGVGWFNIALLNASPSITGGIETSYAFESDGTPIIITATASDPEGLPVTWSYQVTSGSLGDTVITQDGNEFTLTPSTDPADSGIFVVTFTASDGINLATAASSFTLVFTVSNSKYTSLLLKATDNNGVNTSFVDNSSNALTVTPTGDAYQTSFSPYRVGGYSTYFDGTDDYLQVPSSDAFGYGTDDFTIEFWAYFTTISGSTPNLIDQRNGANGVVPTLYLNNGVLRYYVNGVNRWAGPTMSAGIWYHIAVVRDTNVTKFYVNGVAQGVAYSDSNNYIASPVRVFADNDGGAVVGQAGYCKDLRIVKGTAVYTSDFTPPTEPLTAISGTSLLTCNNPSITDQSSNDFAITKNGDVKTVPFTPFDYVPVHNSGSVLLDGDGDGLTFPYSTPLGTQDFTIESWVYLTANPASGQGMIFSAPWGAGTGWQMYVNQTTHTIQCQIYSFAITSPSTIQRNTWYHIAWCRESGVHSLYINGKYSTGSSSDYNAGSNPGSLYVGHRQISLYFPGYITDTRFVHGTALYNADFTPPTEPIGDVTNAKIVLNNSNAKVYDLSQSNDLKLIGDAKSSTAQAKFASTSSVSFDGAGDSISISGDTAVGLSDFTVEAWVYPTGFVSYQSIFSTRAGNVTNAFSLGYTSTGYGYLYSNAFDVAGTAGLITQNTWVHIAVSRQNGTMRLFINGTLDATSSSNKDYATTGGSIGANTNGSDPLSAYVQDLRLTKGLARYTANFTPPVVELAG